MEDKKPFDVTHKLIKKIDGIFVFGTTWNFLNPCACISMKFPAQIQRLKPSSFKGCRKFKDSSSILAIKIGRIMDYNLSLVFYSSNYWVCYKMLMGIYTKAFHESLEELQGSESRACYQQQVWTQKEIFYVNIYASDYNNLGTILAKRIASAIHELSSDLPPINYTFMGDCLGQSGEISLIIPQVENLNAGCVDEAVLHFAFDISKESYHGLWLRESWVRLLGRSPNYEYFPCALAGKGNYYFFDPSWREFSAPGTPKIIFIKPYSSINRHAHRNSIKPFGKAGIAKALYYNGSGILLKNKKEFNFKKFTKQIEMVKRMIVTNVQSMYARIEFGISVLHPDFEFQESCLASAEKWLENHDIFNDAFLKWTSFEIIQTRLHYYLIPAINTISEKINSYFDSKQNNELYIFSLQDFYNVEAAEALICFMLYGSAVSTIDQIAHDNGICRDLGLQVHRFRKNVQNVELLDIRFENGKIQYIPSTYQSNIFNDCKNNGGTDIAFTVMEALAGRYFFAAAFIFRLIVYSVLICLGRKTNMLILKETHYVPDIRRQIRIVQPWELVDWLRKCVDKPSKKKVGEHGYLVWMLKRFDELFSEAWHDYLVNYVELELTRQNTFLCFPKYRSDFIVLPLRSLVSQIQELTLHVNVLDMYMNLYRFLYKKPLSNYRTQRILKSLNYCLNIYKAEPEVKKKYFNLTLMFNFVNESMIKIQQVIPEFVCKSRKTLDELN